jgi:hypothetical protein
MIIKILLTLVVMLTLVQAQEEEIRAASKALLEVSHFRGVSTIEWDGEVSETTMEYVAPDRFRVDSGDLGVTVAIGSTTYMEFLGEWEVSDMDMGELLRMGMEMVFDDDVLSDIQVLPDETIDGKACSVYSFTHTRSLFDVVSQVKLWVDKATGLPLIYEGESELVGLATLRYDYDVVPEINAPIQ